MKLAIRFYTCVSLLLLVAEIKAQSSLEKTQQFALQNISLQPGERLDSIEFQVKGGSFVGFEPLPMGWYLTIDNDSSQQTSIKGDIRIGTVALEETQISKLRIRVQKVLFRDEKFRFQEHSASQRIS